MASQITSLTIVYSTVYSGVDQRKYQSSASLAFVRGIHRWPVNSPHKGPVTRKMFSFDDVIMCKHDCVSLFQRVMPPSMERPMKNVVFNDTNDLADHYQVFCIDRTLGTEDGSSLDPSDSNADQNEARFLLYRNRAVQSMTNFMWILFCIFLPIWSYENHWLVPQTKTSSWLSTQSCHSCKCLCRVYTHHKNKITIWNTCISFITVTSQWARWRFKPPASRLFN